MGQYFWKQTNTVISVQRGWCAKWLREQGQTGVRWGMAEEKAGEASGGVNELSGEVTEQTNHCRHWSQVAWIKVKKKGMKAHSSIHSPERTRPLKGMQHPCGKGMLSAGCSDTRWKVWADWAASLTSGSPCTISSMPRSAIRSRGLAAAFTAQLAMLGSQDRLGSGKRLFNYRTDSPINQECSREEESGPVSYCLDMANNFSLVSGGAVPEFLATAHSK